MRTVPFTVMLLFLLLSGACAACDICGNFMGVTPYHNRNSISFLHRYRVFNGYRHYQEQSRFFPPAAYRTLHGGHAQDSVPETMKAHSARDFESYKVFELRLKYFVHRRIELNAFVPLLDNKTKTDGAYEHHTGFGDVSFNAGFHILLPDETHAVKQKLVAGAGIKLPTGNFYAHNASSQRLPFEMQPGTGSTDGFLYVNYILMYGEAGLSLNGNYKLNGQNIYKEKVSNSTTDFLSVFYKLKYREVMFYPSAQCYYEYTKGLQVKHIIQPSTAVNVVMLGPGLDLYYRSFSVNAAWQFTVFEKVLPGELKSAGRLSLGLNYNFGGKQ